MRILTDEMVEAIKAYFPRYPTRQAVTLPALHVVNERLRHVPLQAVVEIAELLELAPAEVQDTLSFYGFFKQDEPHGRDAGLGLPLDQLRAARRRGNARPPVPQGRHSAGRNHARRPADARVRRVPRGLRIRALHAGRQDAAQESDA